jgi:hypothetical protein
LHQWREGGNTYLLRICVSGQQQNHKKNQKNQERIIKYHLKKKVPAGSNAYLHICLFSKEITALRVEIIEHSAGLFCVLRSVEIASKVHMTPRSATQAYQNSNLFSCLCITVWDSSGTATRRDRRRRWPLTAAAVFVSGGRGHRQGRRHKDDERRGGGGRKAAKMGPQ